MMDTDKVMVGGSVGGLKWDVDEVAGTFEECQNYYNCAINTASNMNAL